MLQKLNIGPSVRRKVISTWPGGSHRSSNSSTSCWQTRTRLRSLLPHKRRGDTGEGSVVKVTASERGVDLGRIKGRDLSQNVDEESGQLLN